MYETSYGRNGLQYVSPINTIIIAINIIVFLVLRVLGDTESARFMYDHGANFWPALVVDKEYYRLLTSAFIHFTFSHLINNMIVLAYLGDNLERAIGKVKYLIFYLLAAVGSGVISTLWSWKMDSYAVSGGASGAIFAVVGALLVIVIKNHGRLENLDSRRLGLFAIFTIYHGVTSAGIDNAAHVGGFILGIILGSLFYRKPSSRYKRW